VACGLALRMDHGTQYLSDHFVNQACFRGIEASYAFLEQPQTNGVAEGFHSTLKEQRLTTSSMGLGHALTPMTRRPAYVLPSSILSPAGLTWTSMMCPKTRSVQATENRCSRPTAFACGRRSVSTSPTPAPLHAVAWRGPL
jgi:transposase InsO family protein